MIGETVNNYRITSLLGEGGMGAVYAAEHPFMGRKAAIKVLRREFAEDVSLVERFMNEARAANAIRHPNIIDIIDVGRLPSGIPYLMMEFLEGESLAHRLTRGALGVPEAVDIMLQTTAALAAAHGKGIVHRDLKPDNLYLVPDDSASNGIRVKVLDFGIAKLRADMSGGMAKTQAGSLMGTPPYMSPEQCRGVSEDVDHRTDVYAMGIILFEMLCGEPPFMSAGWGDVVLAHLTKPPPSPRTRNASIPESIEVVIMKALAKAPGERFQSATEMRSALRALSSVSTFPPRPTGTMPVASATATKVPTTFRSATGEVGGTLNTIAETPDGVGAKSRRGMIIGGVAAVVAIGVGVAVATSGSKSASPAAAVAVTAPAPASAAPVAAPPRETPAATQILVRLASEPAGALITDSKRGVVIGATPFEQRLERGPGSLGLRLAKDGYTTVDLDVPMGANFDKTVRLEPSKADAKKTRSTARAASPASARKVAVAKPASTAAAPTAPPPVAPPPVAPNPKAEKW
jgi:serine/threonine-protein kinase